MYSSKKDILKKKLPTGYLLHPNSRSVVISNWPDHIRKTSWYGYPVVPTSPERQVAKMDECEIHLLAENPEARGQGVASRLIRACENEALSRGYSKIVLSTQQRMELLIIFIKRMITYKILKEIGQEMERRSIWFMKKSLIKTTNINIIKATIS